MSNEQLKKRIAGLDDLRLRHLADRVGLDCEPSVSADHLRQRLTDMGIGKVSEFLRDASLLDLHLFESELEQKFQDREKAVFEKAESTISVADRTQKFLIALGSLMGLLVTVASLFNFFESKKVSDRIKSIDDLKDKLETALVEVEIVQDRMYSERVAHRRRVNQLLTAEIEFRIERSKARLRKAAENSPVEGNKFKQAELDALEPEIKYFVAMSKLNLTEYGLYSKKATIDLMVELFNNFSRHNEAINPAPNRPPISQRQLWTTFKPNEYVLPSEDKGLKDFAILTKDYMIKRLNPPTTLPTDKLFTSLSEKAAIGSLEFRPFLDSVSLHVKSIRDPAVARLLSQPPIEKPLAMNLSDIEAKLDDAHNTLMGMKPHFSTDSEKVTRIINNLAWLETVRILAFDALSMEDEDERIRLQDKRKAAQIAGKGFADEAVKRWADFRDPTMESFYKSTRFETILADFFKPENLTASDKPPRRKLTVEAAELIEPLTEFASIVKDAPRSFTDFLFNTGDVELANQSYFLYLLRELPFRKNEVLRKIRDEMISNQPTAPPAP